jgi:hypothetical protein
MRQVLAVGLFCLGLLGAPGAPAADKQLRIGTVVPKNWARSGAVRRAQAAR